MNWMYGSITSSSPPVQISSTMASRRLTCFYFYVDKRSKCKSEWANFGLQHTAMPQWTGVLSFMMTFPSIDLHLHQNVGRSDLLLLNDLLLYLCDSDIMLYIVARNTWRMDKHNIKLPRPIPNDTSGVQQIKRKASNRSYHERCGRW